VHAGVSLRLSSDLSTVIYSRHRGHGRMTSIGHYVPVNPPSLPDSQRHRWRIRFMPPPPNPVHELGAL